MKIFHVYNEKYFPALEKCGFLNEDSGFKIQHAFSLPSELKFNNFAKIGSKLHSIIKEGRIPFYVDRIAGGVTYYKYDFDEALIREYKEILGDWFLGFQLHESASNRRIDWTRVLNRMEGATGPYDEKILAERSIRNYAKTVDGKQLYAFSQGSPAEYSRLTYADTPEKFMNEMRELYLKRMSEVSGLIHPADS